MNRIRGILRRLVDWLLDLLYPDLSDDDDGDGWL